MAWDGCVAVGTAHHSRVGRIEEYMGMKEGRGKLSHLDNSGRARMVDVSAKETSLRRAVGESFVRLSTRTISLISSGKLPKGNAIETARLAGIVAAKRTPELIPLCHPLFLTHMDVQAEVRSTGVRFRSTVTCSGPTGVEMEALVAVSVAALTLYDMVKAVEKGATIEKTRLMEKSGGKSGTFRRRG
jgi:cyclic pyranopterin phosphate synthase